MRLRCDHQPSSDQQDVHHQEQTDANQAELFGENGDDKVSMAFRQKIQMGLGPSKPTLSEYAARANRRFRLNDVPAGTQRIAFWVEKRQHTLLLIIAQDEVPHGHGDGHERSHCAYDPAPAQPTDEQHEGPRGQNQQRRAKIGLFENKHKGDEDHRQADSSVLDTRRQATR